MITTLILDAIVAYLLGSIPFGYLLVRIFRGVDVRETGSGNIGATNVARTGSKGLAIATLALDALKGYVAVAIAFALSWPWLGYTSWMLALSPSVVPPLRVMYSAAALAALCAILGHMFPPWLHFKGGKGVATALGAFTAIAPRAILVSLVLFILVVVLTRYVSLGSIVGAAVFPFAAWWLNPLTRSAVVMFLIGVSSLLVIVRHKSNLRRLMAGSEHRFGARGTS